MTKVHLIIFFNLEMSYKKHLSYYTTCYSQSNFIDRSMIYNAASKKIGIIFKEESKTW